MKLLENPKMKKVLIINIVFSIIVIICGNLFYNKIAVAKTIGSVLFVIQCLVNIILGNIWFNKRKNIFVWMLLAAQIFACAGDIVLEINFANGAIVFGIGHVLFLVAFYVLNKFNWKDIPIIGVLIVVVILLLTLYPSFDFKGMKVVIFAYGIIISIMLGKAFSNCLSTLNNPLKYSLLIGALLFYLSDLFLLFYKFAGIDGFTRFLCLHLYYPANCVLAICAFISIYTNNSRVEK
ncbi:MAG: lysoplasmalogenase [Bacilli bacterium]|nr:lysoplasmalogenase [Bacilli bacterium]